MEKGKKTLKVIICSILGVFVVGGIAFANIPTTETEEAVEPIHFITNTTYDGNMREGKMEIKQEGKDGSKKVTYEITYKGGKAVSRRKLNETIIIESVAKEVVEGAKKYYRCSNGTEYETLEERDECNKKVAWEKQKNEALAECNADPNKTNCWYDEYPGTTLHWRTYTAPKSSRYRTGAICRDGWKSSATGRGACSHHGGVAYWI